MPRPVDRSWLEDDEGPEPDWAEQIRAGRKARGDRLRDLFATFGEPGPPPDAEPYDQDQEQKQEPDP